jgi:[acyl-carrier-protein] S-malonyltransferase
VINNADVALETSPEKIKAALVKQLYSPVRWVEIVYFMLTQGVTTIAECGPGKVLTGLIKRIDKNVNVFSLNQEDAVKEFIR